jgi:hypothetical protein
MDELVEVLIGMIAKLPVDLLAAQQHDGQKMLAVEFHLREDPDFIEVPVCEQMSVVYYYYEKFPLTGR